MAGLMPTQRSDSWHMHMGHRKAASLGSSETVARYELQGKRWRPRGGRELGMNMESNIYKAARMTRWLAVLGMAYIRIGQRHSALYGGSRRLAGDIDD